MKGRKIIIASVLGAVVAAGCGSNGGGTNAGGGSKPCTAQIGIEAPITGPVAVLGQEQLHFAQLALSLDNKQNKTKITLVQGDTQLDPKQATTATQQLTSNANVLAVVGPAGSQEVEAVGPLFARATIAFISGSATKVTLTHGKYPNFFPVESYDHVQSMDAANYNVN